MTWYAARTKPGAQKPQREYVVEVTGSRKGYRIVPSLDPGISAVEKALRERGFDFYMPAEKRLIRDRRHTDLWKKRRFALMVGYVFVKDPHDWWLLSETPGVSGVVESGGVPLPVGLEDILLVRTMEAASEVEFDKQTREARRQLRKKAKSDPRLRMLTEKLDMAGTITVPLDDEKLATGTDG